MRDGLNLKNGFILQKWVELADQVKLVIKDYSQLRLNHGRKVFEIRPTIKWDKGNAVEFLLESLGYNESSDVLPIYIGDDRTDEDAFRVSCDFACVIEFLFLCD